MEHTNIKKEDEIFEKRLKKKDLIFKISALAILICILILLFYIRSEVKNHYEAFDNNPLLFGAEKYGVNVCSCFADDKTFFFDKEKIWQEKTFVPTRGIPPPSTTLPEPDNLIFYKNGTGRYNSSSGEI